MKIEHYFQIVCLKLRLELYANCALFRDLCSVAKENIADGGSTESRYADGHGMLPEVAQHKKHSMLPPVSVETDATVHYRDTIESFADSIREKALQHMNDPNILAAAIAVQRKLDKATTAKQVADVFFQGNSVKRFKSGAAIRVQPTSIARRRFGLSRGTRKMPVGRMGKAKLQKSKSKIAKGASVCKRSRPHCLVENIRRNIANPKK